MQTLYNYSYFHYADILVHNSVVDSSESSLDKPTSDNDKNKPGDQLFVYSMAYKSRWVSIYWMTFMD